MFHGIRCLGKGWAPSRGPVHTVSTARALCEQPPSCSGRVRSEAPRSQGCSLSASLVPRALHLEVACREMRKQEAADQLQLPGAFRLPLRNQSSCEVGEGWGEVGWGCIPGCPGGRGGVKSFIPGWPGTCYVAENYPEVLVLTVLGRRGCASDGLCCAGD